MRRDVRVVGLLVCAFGLGACGSWSGMGMEDGQVADDTSPSDSSPDLDGGPGSDLDGGPGSDLDGGKPPAQDHDGGVPDSGADGAASSEPPLGDDQAGYEQCGKDDSCGKNEICCTTNTAAPQSSCGKTCGETEGSYTCDGPEDCDDGKVCCHQLTATGLKGACIAAESEASDAGAAPPQCVTLADGPEKHLACHVDADCKDTLDTPLCRAASASGRDFLGYCAADTDQPATPGHDEQGVVSCGSPDDAGTGALCSLSSELCCQSLANPAVAACSAREECGFSELSVTCDGPEDCRGATTCCFVPEQTGHQVMGSPTASQSPRSGADGDTTPARSICAKSCAALAEDSITRCHEKSDCAKGQICAVDEASPWWGRCTAP